MKPSTRHGLILSSSDIRVNPRPSAVKDSAPITPTRAASTGATIGLAAPSWPYANTSPANCAPGSGDTFPGSTRAPRVALRAPAQCPFEDFSDQTNLIRVKGVSPSTVLVIGALALLALIIAYTFACAF